MNSVKKFFLILAGVLVLLGIILCITGAVVAKKAGFALFSENVDGNSVYTLDLSDKDICKFGIKALNTDITVITGAEKNYMEFINFNESKYSLTTRNRVVSFSEDNDFKSSLEFWNGDFSFKGIRSVLKIFASDSASKKINIYVTDVSEIKVFDFDIEDGFISVSDASGDTDYIINMDAGKIDLQNVTTTSCIDITANDSIVKIVNCEARSFNADISVVQMDAYFSQIRSIDFSSAGRGFCNINATLENDGVPVDVSSDGTVTVNGESYGGNYSNNIKPGESDEVRGIRINGTELNVNLNYYTGAPLED